MKSVLKYLVIVLLLVVALPFVVSACSSNTTAMYANSPTPTPSNYTTPTFAPFFDSIFGVRIFPGADHIGTYSVNRNPNYVYPQSTVTSTPTPTPTATPTPTPEPEEMFGTVRGHITDSYTGEGVQGMFVYLSNGNGLPLIPYIVKTGNNGYYLIDNVPYGEYTGYIALTKSAMLKGKPYNKGRSITLDSTTPNVVASGSIDLPR